MADEVGSERGHVQLPGVVDEPAGDVVRLLELIEAEVAPDVEDVLGEPQPERGEEPPHMSGGIPVQLLQPELDNAEELLRAGNFEGAQVIVVLAQSTGTVSENGNAADADRVIAEPLARLRAWSAARCWTSVRCR